MDEQRDPVAPATPAERELSGHILTVSGGLVGVCLTVMGVLRVVGRLRPFNSVADDLLALDALGFLVATLAAYLALRDRHPHRRHRLERTADTTFLLSLALMVAICGIIAYALT